MSAADGNEQTTMEATCSAEFFLAAIRQSPRRRIVVLLGGRSGEREVSLRSGQNAARALGEAGHEVTLIDSADDDFISQLLEADKDVVFLALHGRDGEDGSIQGLMELLRIPYTGSGVLASALAMDKRRSKVFYRNAGLNVPDSIEVSAPETALADAGVFASKYGYPIVVKPSADGSSLGVSIVHNAAELPEALSKGFAISRILLIEQFIPGTEITIPVIGFDTLQALPVIEIVPLASEFYDYEAKYADGGSDHFIPARLPDAVLALAQQQAVAAHRALGCSGMSRSDFIVDVDGKAWIIETNTIPGMTGTSLLPESARHFGIENSELYTCIVEWGIAAHAE